MTHSFSKAKTLHRFADLMVQSRARQRVAQSKPAAKSKPAATHRPTPPELGGWARDFAPTQRFYQERAKRIRSEIAEANAAEVQTTEEDAGTDYARMYPTMYNTGDDHE